MTLDRLLTVNVTAPARLTARLLPAVRAARGQIVLINSTQGLSPKAGVGSYAVSKTALRTFADTLRDEVADDGIRVLSVFPGATDSAMQRDVQALAGRPYDPRRFMDPQDVAGMVLAALAMPRRCEVTDIVMRPARHQDLTS